MSGAAHAHGCTWQRGDGISHQCLHSRHHACPRLPIDCYCHHHHREQPNMPPPTPEITHKFVRAAYNSQTPFYQWHEVTHIEAVYGEQRLAITRCGVMYTFPWQGNTFVDEDTVTKLGGDRCENGCIVPEMVV